MIKINENKCIGCGACVKDCMLWQKIELVDGKAKVKDGNCILCGHCVAICPTNAVEIVGYNMDEVVEHEQESFNVGAEQLLNTIKFRRSVRQFKNLPVEKEKLQQVVEAGRYTATAVNRQMVSYIVVQDQLKELTDLVIESLYQAGNKMLEQQPDNQYASLWIKMHEEKKQGKDLLFYDASALIIVLADAQASSNPDVDAALAASNMELMVNAQGLGACFNGFFVLAANMNPKIKEFLAISEQKKIVTTLAIGYPAVNYKRTVPRKAAEVVWR